MTDLPSNGSNGLLRRLTTNTYLNGSLGTAILASLLSIAVWGIRLEFRVEEFEKHGSPVVIELDKKLTVLTERQAMAIDRINSVDNKVDGLMSMVNYNHKQLIRIPIPKPRPKPKSAPKVALPQQGPSTAY